MMEYTGPPPNMTIAEFQALHELGNRPATRIDTNVVITGIVTSTDEFGSSYKEIFFQDETGGLSIRTTNPSYFNKYRIGQRIFVQAEGLYLGNYISGGGVCGFYQLGKYTVNGKLEQIASKTEAQHIFRDGYPGTRPKPEVIRNTDDIKKGIGGDYHKLVTLENCYFNQADGEATYYFSSSLNTVSRRISFNNGTGFVEARISKFCSFANDILPQGILKITGILTVFGTTSQIIICDIKDVITPKTLLEIDMEKNPFDLGWKNEQLAGNIPWAYREGTSVQVVPVFGQENACRFVSPKLNLTGNKNVELVFSYRLPTGTSENFQVLYSIDGTNWNTLDFTPQTGVSKEGSIALDHNLAANPNLQIAFQYKTTASAYPSCMIYKVSFQENVF